MVNNTTFDWRNDEDLEKAMLQSSLFFLKTNLQGKRDYLFQKSILSLVISKKANTISDIVDFYKKHNFNVDDNQVKSAINSLHKKEKIIEITKDGEIVLSEGKQKDLTVFTNEVESDLKNLIASIFSKVQSNYKRKIDNDNQVIANIKECLNYYFKVSSLSYFDIVYHKEVTELTRLKTIASNNLNSNSEELISQILFTIGQIIENPTAEQQKILNTLARLHVTAQIMNLDPTLANFKATQLKGKIFIIDTDIVLHAITQNASHSKQYKLMLEQLQLCGCKLYIPQEVIIEVYNHGEASKKRFGFVSHLIGKKEEDAPKNLGNVFIEDFHYSILRNAKNTPNWNRFIGNYYNAKYGIEYTTDVIKDTLGERISYSELPPGANIDQNEYDQLYSLVLEETIKTAKAQYREYEKNEDIAHADCVIYLTVRSLNNNPIIQSSASRRSGELMNSCYFLSSSYRVHDCAKQLGLDAKVLCNPKALLAYMAEVGIINADNVEFTKLFDNPFLIYTAKIVEEDLDSIVKSGIDLQGENIVRLKYEFKDEIQNLLTSPEDYKTNYDKLSAEGVKFIPEVAEIMQNEKNKEEIIAQLTAKLEEANRSNQEKDEIIKSKDKQIGVLKYQNRVGQKAK